MEPPTRTILSISFLVRSESSRTFWKGFSVPVNTVVDGQVGDVEGSAAEIEVEDILLALLHVHTITIGNGSGNGLVDDPHRGHTSNGNSVLGGLDKSWVSNSLLPSDPRFTCL